jgi:hypothetical protein
MLGPDRDAERPAIGRQPKMVPDGAPVHCERHRPENAARHRLVQQQAASFIARTEAGTGSELPRFIKDGFCAFLECRMLVQGLPRLRGGDRARPYGVMNVTE